MKGGALSLALILAGWGGVGEAAEPTFRTQGGLFLLGAHHEYFVETELRVPVLQLGPVGAAVHYRETTPFVRYQQIGLPELLYRQADAQFDWQWNDHLRLIGLLGEVGRERQDTPGQSRAGIAGAGIGSPVEDGPWRWSVLGGGYFARQHLAADAWLQAEAAWRFLTWRQDRYRDTDFCTGLELQATFDALHLPGRWGVNWKVGPALQLQTASGNRASLQLLWYHNDDHVLLGRNGDGLVLGLEFRSLPATKRVERVAGWFPLLWGAYEAGVGVDRQVTRYELNSEVVDFNVFDQPVTLAFWYESRQEHLTGDYDNIAYTFTIGLQTPLPVEWPLVAGLDWLHRSDHSLNPRADRVPVGGRIVNGNHNLVPRLRLQTRGWDLPYRSPTMYDTRRTEWLNQLDWRVTVAGTAVETRQRGWVAGQWGVNWDAATVNGNVVYARGLASFGNESPDWLAEIGVRRKAGKVFVRTEDYGMNADLAHGVTLVAGVGLSL